MQFGLGLFGVGAAGFGSDPVPATSVYIPAKPPAALFFDPKTRDFRIDSLGRFVEMDPIDQQVVLSFSVRRGVLQHAPEVGHDFFDMRPLSGSALDAEIARLAPLASPFDTLLRAGTVFLIGVNVFHPKRTESRIVIQYSKRGDATPVEVRLGLG